MPPEHVQTEPHDSIFTLFEGEGPLMVLVHCVDMVLVVLHIQDMHTLNHGSALVNMNSRTEFNEPMINLFQRSRL